MLLVVNGEQGVGPGDRFIARHLLAAQARDDAGDLRRQQGRPARPGGDDRGARRGRRARGRRRGLPDLARSAAPGSSRSSTRLAELVPEGPLLYPPEERTDQPSEVHLAELIREQVLRRTREELPHAVEVAVEEIAERDDGLIEVRAQIWAETESQKAILIGKGGRMVREIGTAARKELERELGAKVFLDLQVRVRERWRRDEGCSTGSGSTSDSPSRRLARR